MSTNEDVDCASKSSPAADRCFIPETADWLTPLQVAYKTQMSLKSVVRAMQSGSIPSRLIGKKRRIHRSIIDL
ncbi:hypothetical protein ACVWZX_004899 [Deinococcus sp. UYEF24]